MASVGNKKGNREDNIDRMFAVYEGLADDDVCHVGDGEREGSKNNEKPQAENNVSNENCNQYQTINSEYQMSKSRQQHIKNMELIKEVPKV